MFAQMSHYKNVMVRAASHFFDGWTNIWVKQMSVGQAIVRHTLRLLKISTLPKNPEVT
jgi:hypothetical protein